MHAMLCGWRLDTATPERGLIVCQNFKHYLLERQFSSLRLHIVFHELCAIRIVRQVKLNIPPVIAFGFRGSGGQIPLKVSVRTYISTGVSKLRPKHITIGSRLSFYSAFFDVSDFHLRHLKKACFLTAPHFLTAQCADRRNLARFDDHCWRPPCVYFPKFSTATTYQ